MPSFLTRLTGTLIRSPAFSCSATRPSTRATRRRWLAVHLPINRVRMVPTTDDSLLWWNGLCQWTAAATACMITLTGCMARVISEVESLGGERLRAIVATRFLDRRHPYYGIRKLPDRNLAEISAQKSP
jgi:hypothetical protein